MKIGILSMQRVVNYGSFLQAFSLKNNIENLGHECEFIDIKIGKKLKDNGEDFTMEFKSNRSLLSKIDKYILKRIEHKFFERKREKLFKKEYFKLLGMNDVPNIDGEYDVVVIGSDEVFNCTQKSEWGFSPQLLGGGLNSKKVITYAASCGFTTVDKVEKYGIKTGVIQALRNLTSISVRDNNTKEFVEAFINRNVSFNLDPVFIMNYDKYMPRTEINYEYILIYSYDNRINQEDDINKIREFAKKNNLKIISVGVYQRWCDKNILVDPFELLSYVKNAKYVLTDTFHGSVFSIKYNKKFATIIKESNKNKLVDLLNRFRLDNRAINNLDNLESILKDEINYNDINKFIDNEVIKSREYLKSNLKIT